MSAVALMQEVIKKHTTATIWTGSPLESFRQVANTNRGDIGEEFVYRYLKQSEIPVSQSESRVKEWDLLVAGKRFEVKTASEDVGGSFQFNHIRLDRDYQYLLCLGVRPAAIMFGVWRKGAVSEGEAGRLVRMAEGQSVTYKLTKKPTDMMDIKDLPRWVRDMLMSGS